jgi:hypothetical protein
MLGFLMQQMVQCSYKEPQQWLVQFSWWQLSDGFLKKHEIIFCIVAIP